MGLSWLSRTFLSWAVLAMANDCVVSRVFFSNPSRNLLHNLTSHRSETDRPVITSIFLLTLPENGDNICQLPVDRDLSRLPEPLKDNGRNGPAMPWSSCPVLWQESHRALSIQAHPAGAASLQQVQGWLGVYRPPSHSLPAQESGGPRAQHQC